MRVSVVLPVRDGGAYLALAVASMLSQTWRDFELILVNDGSQDGAVEILSANLLGETRLRVLRNPGRGLVAALNFGLAQAQGEYVARMDADDIALPDRLASQVECLDRRKDIAVVGAQVAFIDASGALTGGRTHFPTDPDRIAAALTTRGCVLKHPSVLARWQALLDVGGYRAAVAGAEDYDLWLRLAERTRLANLPDILLHYREHPGQISTGVNLGQRFAHDLALIAARARRAGEADPLDGVGEAPSLDQVESWAAMGSPALKSLASAYRALGFFEGAILTAPDRAALSDLIESARRGLLGDGRRFRAQALTRCAEFAWRRGDWRLAFGAARLALRLAPGRAAAWLVSRIAIARTTASGSVEPRL
ncbi:MAG: glycosyltransferase [Bradyrhizobium sp.]|nr:MAG: glycosyltransferase [Bradyrhizobium sp.]